jgi:hypothetical protein
VLTAFGLSLQHQQLALIVLSQLTEDLRVHVRKEHVTELRQTSEVRSVSECSKRAQFPATGEAVRAWQGKVQEEGGSYHRSWRTSLPGDGQWIQD